MSDKKELIARIWERDPSTWTGGEEAKWLGWLDEPHRMRERVAELAAFADEVADDGLDAIVLLGMGGSSLAPEVLRRTFRVESFHVLDTTHPRAIRDLEARIDLGRTLFVSASKSGSTLETRSHTEYFWERSGKRGERFVAIEDDGGTGRVTVHYAGDIPNAIAEKDSIVSEAAMATGIATLLILVGVVAVLAVALLAMMILRLEAIDARAVIGGPNRMVAVGALLADVAACLLIIAGRLREPTAA